MEKASGCIEDLDEFERKKKRILTSTPTYVEWLEPLLSLCPPTLHPDTWIDFLFQTTERPILRYRASHFFYIQCKRFMGPLPPVKMKHHITYPAGSEVWVRWDKALPDTVHVEVVIDEGEEDSDNFILTFKEWARIARHMIEMNLYCDHLSDWEKREKKNEDGRVRRRNEMLKKRVSKAQV